MADDAAAHLDEVARAIAAAVLVGEWNPYKMAARAGRAIGDDRYDTWLLELALHLIGTFRYAPTDAPNLLVETIRRSTDLVDRYAEDRVTGRPPWDPASTELPTLTSVFTAMARSRWPVLPVDTLGDLAAELGLHPTRLAWFADVRSLERTARDEALRHYRYRWLPKRTGGSRLLEAPKPHLKFLQRRLLRDILDAIPAHDAAHGFRRGRSIHTFVAPHVGRDVVVRIDLEGFFPSVDAGRVFGVFRTAGYPYEVAHSLTGLVTNAVPLEVLEACPRLPPDSSQFTARRRMLHHLAHPHVPQGAPTSPALANLVAHRLDRRLAGLARSFGAAYTRYADDLAFSGAHRFARATPLLIAQVEKIARDEGFRVHARKTRVQHRSQRQSLGGLVVNEVPNVQRVEYDRLKAVLHDAARHGPETANREAHADLRSHLLGRITWIEAANPRRGASLRSTYEQIDWP